jgi:hypothetical protein
MDFCVDNLISRYDEKTVENSSKLWSLIFHGHKKSYIEKLFLIGSPPESQSLDLLRELMPAMKQD